jgi:16S rRNA pseudouridine516 synthase
MATRRIDQILSALGYGSRRDAAALVAQGRVLAAGEPVGSADQRVEPDSVTLDGQPLDCPGGVFAMLHKPADFVCSHSEADGAPVYGLLPPRWRLRRPPVTSVGRLDKDTTGLLLVTDDGQLVHRLTSPRADVEKVYEVTVDRPLEAGLVGVFGAGTLVLRNERDPCLPAALEITGPLTARLTLREGRYHQVKRMFASQGWHVVALHRSRFGPWDLGNLKPGEWSVLEKPAW